MPDDLMDENHFSFDITLAIQLQNKLEMGAHKSMLIQTNWTIYNWKRGMK